MCASSKLWCGEAHVVLTMQLLHVLHADSVVFNDATQEVLETLPVLGRYVEWPLAECVAGIECWGHDTTAWSSIIKQIFTASYILMAGLTENPEATLNDEQGAAHGVRGNELSLNGKAARDHMTASARPIARRESWATDTPCVTSTVDGPCSSVQPWGYILVAYVRAFCILTPSPAMSILESVLRLGYTLLDEVCRAH